MAARIPNDSGSEERSDPFLGANIDAEREILAAMLVSREGLHEARGLIEQKDFYRSAHARIFGAILTIDDRDGIVDLLTLRAELQSQGLLENCGGVTALAELMEHAPVKGAGDLKSRVKLVRERAVRRAVRDAGRRLVEAAQNVTLPIAEGIRRHSELIRSIADDHDGSATKLPVIVLRKQLASVADEAEAALFSAFHSQIFSRGPMLVRVHRIRANAPRWLKRDAGAPEIMAVCENFLREQLDRAARWLSDRGEPALVPKWVPETLLSRSEWPALPLLSVTETPLLCEGGSVLARPGYDPESGLLFEPREEFPPMPEAPTLDDAREALRLVLEPLREFPFETEGDRAGAVAAVLTILARPSILGPTPIFAIRAPTGGTGKNLLGDVIGLIGTGRTPARLTVSRNEDESRKRIFAIGLSGDPIVLLDNIDHALGSESLASALTSETFGDRLLGQSRYLTVPMRAVWLATGNGLTFQSTLGRRVVPIGIDAGSEFPEDRSGFTHSDLLEFVRQNRARLVIASLTILQAFWLAGRPEHGMPLMGSFERWDRIVRSACIWVGLSDPCSGRAQVREEGDRDLELVRASFAAWYEVFADQGVTVAHVKSVAEERLAGLDGVRGDYVHPELHAALSAMDPRASGDRLNARAIGDQLRSWKGKVARGLVLTSESRKVRKAAVWRITKKGSSGSQGSQGSRGSRGDMEGEPPF